ncbi:MAG: hypothetical protein EPN93_06845 [Spirochaetes bacterium]|nr:MAG: hypothetical protein EPN93_06845 [Spirochaetota bacterium]
MTSRAPFAATWWGKQWIEALERIDINTNRLGRGRSYARDGNVVSIKLEAGQIIARVKGRTRSPYSIRITLKRFSRPVMTKIIRLVADNPLIASQLSLGKLPEELLDTLERDGIHVLPQSWRDISSSCSCPDWADPCKHMAAVYYLMGREIDKDPFLLFNLRGVATGDLTGTAAHDTETRNKSTMPVPLFGPLRGIKGRPAPAEFGAPLAIPDFDFRSLLGLLPDRPLFYPAEDFKKLLIAAYAQASTRAASVDIADEAPHLLKMADFRLIFPAKGPGVPHVFVSPPETAKLVARGKGPSPVTMDIPVEQEGSVCMAKARGSIFSLGEVFSYFQSIPLQTGLDGASATARFMSVLAQASLSLIKAGAYLPEPVDGADGEFSIRYVPCKGHHPVEEIIAAAGSIMPAGMGFQRGKRRILAAHAVEELFSLGVSATLRLILSADTRFSADKIASVFFTDEGAFVPERFDERAAGATVRNWLDRFASLRGDIAPVIKIGESKGDYFTLEILAENKKDAVSPPLSLDTLYAAGARIFERPAHEVRASIARQAALAGEHLPELKTVLAGKGSAAVLIGMERMGEILSRHAPFFETIGVRFLLPKALKNLLKPELTVAASSPATVRYLNLDSLLNFSWEISIGGERISGKEFARLCKEAAGIVRFKDKYLLLDPDEARKIIERLARPPRPSTPVAALFAALTGELQGIAVRPDTALKKLIDSFSSTLNAARPSGIAATPRPYQERGFDWLYSNLARGLGCCIADDMGLGKTLQVIMVLQKLKDEGLLGNAALVVCPTTLVGNWSREIERFAPGLRVSIYHGTEKARKWKGFDIVITTYGLVRRNETLFGTREWDLVVIDEAQNIKNPSSDQSAAVKKLKAVRRVAMSGTPVENRLTELWSIFDFFIPGYLGPLRGFKADFALPIERYRDEDALAKLKKATAPFILRRLKSDKTIISDLPDKIVSDCYCPLTPEQAVLYEQVVASALRKIEESEGIERRGLIFQLITHLKQICNHPVHFSGRGDLAPGISGKAGKTMELLERIVEHGEKALIFTQYRRMGEMLEKMIARHAGEKTLFFHGGLVRAARDRMVKRFQDGGEKILIISLKAGGTGLNLTRATQVIHYDLWWNPAVENQATDRAYRIGQKSAVQVHRLITMGTFEEKIDGIIKKKQELADLAVSAGETWITEMSNRELKEIFSLG